MDEIVKKARELLETEYRNIGQHMSANCIQDGIIDSTDKCALRAIAGALRSTQAPKWQPIETAPKDGTHIWLYSRLDHPVSGYWLVVDGDDYHWEGWMYSDELLSDVKPDGLTPSHWMPLPAAPTAQGKANG